MNNPLKSNDEQNYLYEEGLYISNKETTANYSSVENYEQYEKICMQHVEEITKLETISNISKFTGVISFLSFLIMLAIKISHHEANKLKTNPSKFSLFYLLIPGIITLISITIYSNSYLMLKEIFDKAIRLVNRESQEDCSLGSFISFVCINLTSMCVLIYLIMGTIKLEEINSFLTIQYNLISIPIYITFGILTFYIIFIVPAFLYHKYYIMLVILLIYLICSFASFFLITLKLDKYIEKESYLTIMYPILIAIGFHSIYKNTCICSERDTRIFSRICDAIGINLVLAGSIMVPLILDGIFQIQKYIPVIIFIFALLFLVDYRVFNFSDNEEVQGKEQTNYRY